MRYDYILVGGGAAGRSLALHLAHSPLAARRMLIIDPQPKTENDRTWCFWAPDPTLYEPIIHRRWNTLNFISDDLALELDISPYEYRVIRGIDFYRFTTEQLTRCGVEFLQERVDAISEAEGTVTVSAGGREYHADWAFDSRWDAVPYHGGVGGSAGSGATSARAASDSGVATGRDALAANVPDPRYHYLQQHFLGWVIRTEQPCFDTSRATLFDLRTPQNGIFRFVYTLPFSETEAMCEYTIFSADLLPPHEYRNALDDYIQTYVGAAQSSADGSAGGQSARNRSAVDEGAAIRYRIVEEEACVIPMTDEPFPRRGGNRVMRIGTRGGRVKASSGYAFLRIARDSAAIVRSLLETGQPFHGRVPPRRYNTFDSMLLQILHRNGDLGKRVFTDLFQKNPVQRIFRFLDEEGSLSENLALMATVPWWPFIRAWLKLRLGGRV